MGLPAANNVTCSTCHTGLEFGSLNHYNAAKAATPAAPSGVAFASPNLFQSESGGASGATTSATSLTCSNISCHGGQTTPGWQSGILVTASACTSCHASGTAQFNSYNSGEHSFHINERGLACTACHDMANGLSGALNHFTTLNTTSMVDAANTIRPLPGGGSYNGSTCTTTCHEEVKSW
jgi:predicted CxxxxCH...CXXCH cytochrome family protein